MDGHIQAKIKTNLQKLSLPEFAFSLPLNAGTSELNVLVNKLVNDANEEANAFDETRIFDFLINGILLRVNLEQFLNEYGLSTEDVLQIECILKAQAPSPEPSLPHDDWVGSVKATSKCVFTACYDRNVHVWSLGNQKHRLTVTGHSGPVKCLTILQNTNDKQESSVKFATGSQDQSVMVWHYDLHKNLAHCTQVGRGHERSVECLCSNFDGTRLASGSFDNYVKIWSADDAEATLPADENGTAKKKFKTGKDGNKSMVKTPLVTLAGHHEVVSGVCWSDQAEIVTCSFDKNLALWDLQAASQKSSFASSTAFTSVAHSTLNGLLVTGSTDPYVRLWDPRNKAVSAAKSVYSSHTNWVVDVDWSKTNENHFVSASYDKILKIWDIRSFKAPLYDLAGHEDRCLSCDWSNPAYVISGGVDCSVKLYSVPS